MSPPTLPFSSWPVAPAATRMPFRVFALTRVLFDLQGRLPVRRSRRRPGCGCPSPPLPRSLVAGDVLPDARSGLPPLPDGRHEAVGTFVGRSPRLPEPDSLPGPGACVPAPPLPLSRSRVTRFLSSTSLSPVDLACQALALLRHPCVLDRVAVAGHEDGPISRDLALRRARRGAHCRCRGARKNRSRCPWHKHSAEGAARGPRTPPARIDCRPRWRAHRRTGPAGSRQSL